MALLAGCPGADSTGLAGLCRCCCRCCSRRECRAAVVEAVVEAAADDALSLISQMVQRARP
jgi:hypothetical protein